MNEIERLQILAAVSERRVRAILSELWEKERLTLLDLERAAFRISEILENSHDIEEIAETVHTFYFQIILRRGMEKMLRAIEAVENLDNDSDSGQSESSFIL